MKKYFYLICLIILFSGCSNKNDEKDAREILNKANAFYNEKEYASAKLSLDYLKTSHPNQVAILREGLQLMRRIELTESERDLAFCDSMLIVQHDAIDKFKQKFVYEKDEDYDDVGKYMHKSQVLENNIGRSYIRSGVNEAGEMYIASVYYGKGAIKHKQLKVSLPNGDYTETEEIAEDDGMNYSFVDDKYTTEVVTYQNERDNGVIMFICNNIDKKLTAEFCGGKRKFQLVISQPDKDAILDAKQLSTMITDVERLNQQIAKLKGRINYLKDKI